MSMHTVVDNSAKGGVGQNLGLTDEMNDQCAGVFHPLKEVCPQPHRSGAGVPSYVLEPLHRTACAQMSSREHGQAYGLSRNAFSRCDLYSSQDSVSLHADEHGSERAGTGLELEKHRFRAGLRRQCVHTWSSACRADRRGTGRASPCSTPSGSTAAPVTSGTHRFNQADASRL
eukprot:scaffold418_cov386-Prasinococcus_capsulatus_cf.AAC.30